MEYSGRSVFKKCAMITGILVANLTSIAVQAQSLTEEYAKALLDPLQHQFVIEQNNQALTAYKEEFSLFKDTPRVERPFSELEDAGYLIFSADEMFASGPAKRAMAEALPPEVQLVVYTGNSTQLEKERIVARYSSLADEGRLHVVHLPGANRGFWARDGLPIPVIGDRDPMKLVDARYFHNFEPDQKVADMFGVNLLRHQFYFEGGNFIVNSRGDCLVVNNDTTQKMPETLFESKYGCRRLLRLPFVTGIGHADEVVRFVTDDHVFTSVKGYEQTLQEFGYRVTLLPRPDGGRYRTYVNSLLLNGTIFLPVYDVKSDAEARLIYEQIGFEVVPLLARQLSDRGLGAIHCITMTYPPVPLEQLLKDLGGGKLL